MSLIDFPSPHFSAYGARPFTVEELDAHPDKARIWATIVQMRDDFDSREYNAYLDGKADGLSECYAEYD